MGLTVRGAGCLGLGFLLLLLWGGGSRAAGDLAGGGPVSRVRTLARASQGGLDKPLAMVIEDRARLEQVLSRLRLGEGRDKVAKLDFSRDRLVAVFMGQKPSSGYKVEVARVEDEGDKVVVVVDRYRPGPECMTISVITFPYVLAAIPRTDKPVEIEMVDKVRHCGR